MTSFKKPIYFCSECKKVVPQVFDLLFIDEHSHKGFCSEECIEDFYFPLIMQYEVMEMSLRKKLNLVDEGRDFEIDPDLVEEIVTTPSEIYKFTNELEESYYHFIHHFGDYSGVVVATVYQKEASFIFLTTASRSQTFLNEFRHGEKVSFHDDLDEDEIGPIAEDVMVDEEIDDEDEDIIFIQLLESKKSKMLADVLIKRKDNDIPFEDYSGYESCFQETLDSPDEVFEKKDNEGDMIFTYIKSFSRGGGFHDSFYYIVACLKKSSDSTTVNVYPILALPTTDMEMCQEFSGGIRLSGPLKN